MVFDGFLFIVEKNRGARSVARSEYDVGAATKKSATIYPKKYAYAG